MKRKRIFQTFLVLLTLTMCLCVPAFAAGGDVAAVTWSDLPERLKGMGCGVNFKADA